METDSGGCYPASIAADEGLLAWEYATYLIINITLRVSRNVISMAINSNITILPSSKDVHYQRFSMKPTVVVGFSPIRVWHFVNRRKMLPPMLATSALEQNVRSTLPDAIGLFL